jgi:hypothetical protein
MQDPDRQELIEHLLRETTESRTETRTGATRTQTLVVLVAAALLADASGDLLADALRLATSTPDRQFVAIAAAYLAGDQDRVAALAGDHLVDHPPRPVLTWIVERCSPATTPSEAADHP